MKRMSGITFDADPLIFTVAAFSFGNQNETWVYVCLCVCLCICVSECLWIFVYNYVSVYVSTYLNARPARTREPIF